MVAMTDTATTLADQVAGEIHRRIAAAVPGAAIEVVNDSHLHAGHAGDDGSGVTHWTVHVTSADFAGLSRVERQRRINHALAELMNAPIHALAIKAKAPGE